MKLLPATLVSMGLLSLACSSSDEPAAPKSPPVELVASFTLLAGSENKALADIFDRVAAQNGTTIKVNYQGSVDIGNTLRTGTVDADAVLPASSFWLQVADTKKVVKDATSIARSPVILGVKRSVIERLGWTGKSDIHIADILSAAESGKLRFGMTSPLQSNSGAVAYFGILSANAGSPEVLLSANLEDKGVQDRTQRLLKTVNRSTHSSGFLKDLVVADDGRLDAMFNYESLVIEANQALVAAGKEPLMAVYPVDGMSIADFPLGCVDHGNDKATTFCHALQAYLLSDAGQKEIEALGRRTGLGLAAKFPDATVFNPAWGIQPDLTITPVTMPTADVAQQALDLYSTLRKPSFKVYVVDVSNSMSKTDDGQNDSRENLMKAAMENVLVPELARTYGFPPASRDVTVVIPFSVTPRDPLRVDGNGADELRMLAQRVKDEPLDGGTCLYTVTVKAMQYFEDYAAQHPDPKDPLNLTNYSRAIILMTDGEPTDSDQRPIFTSYVQAHPAFAEGLPVYAVQFGEAREDVLKELAMGGKVFDGTKNLSDAIRQANGNN